MSDSEHGWPGKYEEMRQKLATLEQAFLKGDEATARRVTEIITEYIRQGNKLCLDLLAFTNPPLADIPEVPPQQSPSGYESHGYFVTRVSKENKAIGLSAETIIGIQRKILLLSAALQTIWQNKKQGPDREDDRDDVGDRDDDPRNPNQPTSPTTGSAGAAKDIPASEEDRPWSRGEALLYAHGLQTEGTSDRPRND